MNYRYDYLWAAPGIEPSIRIPLGCARNLAVHRTLAIEIKTLTSYNKRCLTAFDCVGLFLTALDCFWMFLAILFLYIKAMPSPAAPHQNKLRNLEPHRAFESSTKNMSQRNISNLSGVGGADGGRRTTTDDGRRTTTNDGRRTTGRRTNDDRRRKTNDHGRRTTDDDGRRTTNDGTFVTP